MSNEPTPLSQVSEHLGLRKQALAEKVANDVFRLFRLSVAATSVLTIILAAVDTAFIYLGVIAPASRLITESVIMSVVGATIVQVGFASIAIVYSLFPKKSEPD